MDLGARYFSSPLHSTMIDADISVVLGDSSDSLVKLPHTWEYEYIHEQGINITPSVISEFSSALIITTLLAALTALALIATCPSHAVNEKTENPMLSLIKRWNL